MQYPEYWQEWCSTLDWARTPRCYLLYEHILDMINEAIGDACKQADMDESPVFSYEPSQQLITIQYPNEFIQGDMLDPPYLYFSSNWRSLLERDSG